MAIALSTTTVTVTRNQIPSGADPWDTTPTVVTIATAVRATIDPPTSATEHLVGGDQVVYNSKLISDPIPNLQPEDILTDSVSGNVWTVRWVQQSNALGLVHTIAGLRLVVGST